MDACKKQDLRLSNKLLSEGANADFVCDEYGMGKRWGERAKYTPLHYAILYLPHPSTIQQEENWKQLIQTLVKNGANPNETMIRIDRRGSRTEKTSAALTTSAAFLFATIPLPDAELLSSFLEEGVDPNALKRS